MKGGKEGGGKVREEDGTEVMGAIFLGHNFIPHFPKYSSIYDIQYITPNSIPHTYMLSPSILLPLLSAARNLQIFNLELKAKIKSYVMPDDVVFWKWITPSTLGLVTENAAYHWSMEGTADPVKIFDRHATLVGSQIIHYRMNPDDKWMMVIGISAKVGE